MTAYHALFQNVVVRAAMTARIHSAAGGVGCSLVQLLRLNESKQLVLLVLPIKSITLKN